MMTGPSLGVTCKVCGIPGGNWYGPTVQEHGSLVICPLCTRMLTGVEMGDKVVSCMRGEGEDGSGEQVTINFQIKERRKEDGNEESSGP